MRLILAAMLVTASPVVAQTPAYPVDRTVWRDASDGPRPVNVGITVPRQSGALTLSMLRGFTPGGFDMGANYLSADRTLIGTVYIYRAPGASAGDTLIATSEVIRALYGARVASEGTTLADVGAMPRAALRRVFDGVAFTSEQAMGPGPHSSVLMVLQADMWIVKLRISGPETRRAEVIAEADRLLAALRFDKRVPVVPAAIDTVTDCPPATENLAAARTVANLTDQMAVSLSVVGSFAAATVANPPQPRALCIAARQMTTQGGYLILRPTDGTTSRVTMLVGDAGTRVVAEDIVSSDGPKVVRLDNVSQSAVFGPFDRLPSTDQLVGFANGNAEWLGSPIATATRDAKGNPKINVVMPGK